MKATDLMIGDLVYTNKDYIPIVKIEEIYSHSILTKEAEYESEEIDENDIRPIPLTPDILEKNGFNKIYFSVSGGIDEPIWRNGNIDICRGREYTNICELCIVFFDSDYWDVKVVTPLRYVHELQHALRLCGIEKKIEL